MVDVQLCKIARNDNINFIYLGFYILYLNREMMANVLLQTSLRVK